MKFKKILVSVITLILCLGIFAGCSSISGMKAEDGSVQKEASKNAELKEEIEDIFADTGLTGDYIIEDNKITFTMDMSNFTMIEDKNIDEKEEKKVLELCEKSFSNDHEFDTILKELEEYYNLKDITLVMELKHKNKVIWSKEYKLEKKK